MKKVLLCGACVALVMSSCNQKEIDRLTYQTSWNKLFRFSREDEFGRRRNE